MIGPSGSGKTTLLNYILKQMDHPDGGKYWDHTVVATISVWATSSRIVSSSNDMQICAGFGLRLKI